MLSLHRFIITKAVISKLTYFVGDRKRHATTLDYILESEHCKAICPAIVTPISRIEAPKETMQILYDLGFSFFSFHRALKPTPETLTTLKRTPGISPLALPLRPKPERRTSSFSSTKLRQPSLGTAHKLVCLRATFPTRSMHRYTYRKQ